MHPIVRRSERYFWSESFFRCCFTLSPPVPRNPSALLSSSLHIHDMPLSVAEKTCTCLTNNARYRIFFTRWVTRWIASSTLDVLSPCDQYLPTASVCCCPFSRSTATLLYPTPSSPRILESSLHILHDLPLSLCRREEVHGHGAEE